MAPPLETDFRDMAMDALKNLVNNVPDWLQRLDDLSGEINLRQAELAAIAAAEGKSADTKSLRSKGSTETLKSKDDPPVAHTEASANEDILEDGRGDNTTQTPVKPETRKVHSPSSGSIRQQQEIIKAAQARARAQVRKKPKSPSMMSNEDAPAAYRTRSMLKPREYIAILLGILCVGSASILTSPSRNTEIIKAFSLAAALLLLLALMKNADGKGLASLHHRTCLRRTLGSRHKDLPIYQSGGRLRDNVGLLNASGQDTGD
ncbi:hypothetical protein FGLOB1_13817 [Fusarium globosum]|uniref:Uncharacterized protein n=1 Tax=Fusarium globosum TaxID=78864 RepID=A0A8H6CXP9_9HYPO|nr:hypothetical protein FGLOB1_13817 [Fusarium globosum]